MAYSRVISTSRKFRRNGNCSGAALSPGYSPIAVNADGKIFLGVANGTLGSPGNVTLKVTEFNSNGTVDTSFGTSGTATSGTISGDGNGLILQIQLNGQIVLGIGGAEGHFILSRFNSNGTLDTTFGTSGIKIGAAEGGGLAMLTAPNGETILIGKPSSGNGIILEEFHTLANSQTLYVEYDADYNVTSLTNSSGGVVERYSYDPYGTVTVLNPTGTVRGDGTIGSSFYGWVYTFQCGRTDPVSGLVHFQYRDLNTGLGRWIEQDPAGYVDGPNVYQLELSSPVCYVDPTGLTSWWGDFGNVWVGYAQAAVGVVAGAANVVVHPVNTAKAVVAAAKHPVVAAKAVGHAVAATWKSGARGQGKIVGTVLIAVAAGGAGLAGDGAAAAGAAGEGTGGMDALFQALQNGEGLTQPIDYSGYPRIVPYDPADVPPGWGGGPGAR